MFTWNFLLVSKSRLIDTFKQLSLDSSNGDILIRIHTAAHYADEAVELAKFLKELVPGAMIFGTSTSAIIMEGKLIKERCLISVTQMSTGRIKKVKISTAADKGAELKNEDKLCQYIQDNLIFPDTEHLLTFFTIDYINIAGFVKKSNVYFPGIKMIGGIADCPGSNLAEFPTEAFVFDEDGWTNSGIMIASISGKNVESLCTYTSGVEAIGEDMEITDSLGPAILALDNNDAGEQYRQSIGEAIDNNPALSSLFPYVYSDEPAFPVFVNYGVDSMANAFPESIPENKEYYDSHPYIDKNKKRKLIRANHKVTLGRKMRRAFIYDKKIISDNRAMFRKIESFRKAETIFAYSCIVRDIIYSNCIKWELSAYENSNMSGCITYGEIINADGKNQFVNGTFVVSVLGESPVNQEYNPYAFIYTQSLSYDNEELLNYLLSIEKEFEQKNNIKIANALEFFVRECEKRILFSEKPGIPNAASMNLDVKIKGVDRLCFIEISDMVSMKSVYSDKVIDLTLSNLLTKCEDFAKDNNYNIYFIDESKIAIGAKSYMVSMKDFIKHMEQLQLILFNNSEDYIPVIPVFSVLDNCTVENYENAFNNSKLKMRQKNLQFVVIDAKDLQLEEDAILERYKMVNIINYAIENEKIISHFQGIYDNKEKRIHHYEALMRIEDEYGKMYYPADFLDVARSYGILYDRMSFTMIRNIFEKFKDMDDIGVSINMGIRDIRNKEVVDYIYDNLSVVKHPESFIFELLENEDIDDYNMMINFIDKIHELGGKIAIDDFGSGFSNLQHVISLQADCIKIDGSIVKYCCENMGAENMIALISTWKSLTDDSIKIIAEYVENEEIQNKICDYNIDYSQGYFFSKPSPELGVQS